MKKTKGKVLSLILASAMIVSSFSSMMGASAATRTETGSVEVENEKLYLVSNDDKDSNQVELDDLLGAITMKTYDNESLTVDEISRISHVKGDKLLRFKDGKISVKKNASGQETINVRFEADNERDDKEVTVRASKDITVYVDKAGEVFLAKANESGKDKNGKAKRPGELKAAAVNEQFLNIGVYVANPTESAAGASEDQKNIDAISAVYAPSTNVDIYKDTANAELKKDNVFDKKIDVVTTTNDDDEVTATTIQLKTKFKPADDKKATLARTGKATLEIKLGPDGTQQNEKKTNVIVEVAKKWNADVDMESGVVAGSNNWEIGKKAGKTYILEANAIDWDDKEEWKEVKDSAYAVNSYDEIVSDRDITVVNGSVGNLEAKTVTVEDGTVGDIKAETVIIEKGSAGIIKDKAESVTIENGKVKSIDADKAEVKILGGTISGDVLAKELIIDAEDDDIDTVISGKVTVKEKLEIDSTSDASVEVKGTIKADGEDVTIALSGEHVILGTLDANYSSDVRFVDFAGSIKGLVNANETVELENSKVALSSKLTADIVTVDEDSRLTVVDASVGSIDGEGVFAFPAGKLFVEDGIESDVILEITDGLVVGETAITSYDSIIDVEDLTTRGFTLETKSASKDTEKHVIKAVQFAGVKFDKTELTIAKGYSDTLTVASYPTGTSLPEGATVEWNIDANDDYITMTVEGNVATIKAVDFNADRAIENEATVTATVVDKDGFVIEDLMEASVKVSAVAVPASQVTLDTNKPITLGTGSVYQYIAKSSTGAVLSAASSDAQVATVELFNAADPRGYKFQINALKEGKAVITTTDANGASKAIEVTVTKVNGSLKADTTSYTFAPGAIYDVKFTVNGSTEVPVVSANGKVVSIAPRGNGVYRVTAQNPGTAYVVAKAGNTHVSVKFDVVAGATAKGVTGNNVSLFK